MHMTTTYKYKYEILGLGIPTPKAQWLESGKTSY